MVKLKLYLQNVYGMKDTDTDEIIKNCLVLPTSH